MEQNKKTVLQPDRDTLHEEEVGWRIRLLNERFLTALHQSPYKGKKTVLGRGRVATDLVLVGEAPGGEEEKLGIPFVGSAGKRLNEFLQAIELSRDNIYITNVVKFRPVGISKKTGREINRSPNREEICFCQPFLLEELCIIHPQFVVTLGNYALRATLNDNKMTIGNAHGRVIEKENYKVYPLYHPASVIYNQSLRQVYMEDIHQLKIEMGRLF